MKKLVLGLMMLFALSVFAQSTHTVDFEPAGVGAGWTWIMAENADNPPLEFVANTVSGGINTSATVAKFTARVAGNPWALCFTDDDGQFTFDATNSIIKIMVYKPVISDVGFKVEGGTGSPTQIIVANTQINTWEELTFNFSAVQGQTFGRLVIIPDFTARTQENIIYFDNIQVPNGIPVGPLPEPTTVPPVPSHAAADVLSIYSDAYTNLPGTNFNPNWGQSTAVIVDYVAAGNNTLKYSNLNYQGTQFTNQDVSLYEYIHVDFWTPNATDLNFFLISPGAEISYSFLPFALETWVSVDIPLSAFVPPVNLSNVFQFKVTGNQVVYFDNWYFWKNPSAPGSDATLSDLQINGTTVAGFAPATLNYNVELPYGTTVVPTVTATPTDPQAFYDVYPATTLPGTTSVVVTAQNLITTLTYNVNFTVAGPEPTTVPPTPPHAPEDVISIFSDTYSNLPGTNYNPFWGQSTIVTVNYVAAGNNTLRYENLNYQGTEYTNQDVSGFENLHVDFWTSNSTDLGIYLISTGPQETEYVFTIVNDTWVSVDIPLTDFVPPVNLSDIFQFKVEGNGDIFFDNIYFWKTSGTGILTFNPSNGASNVAVNINPTLSFSIPVALANNNPITNGDIPSLITFKENDAFGADVIFTGTIDAGEQVITVSPTTDLNLNQVYYLALNNEVIKYQGGNLIAEQAIAFSTVSSPLTLPVTFDDNLVNYGLMDFGGNVSSIVADPEDPFNMVVESSNGAETWSGTLLAGPFNTGFSDPIPFADGYTHMSIRVWSPTAGIPVRFKVENGSNGAISVETEALTTLASAWETLIFDFSNEAIGTPAINYAESYSKPVVFFNFGATGNGEVYYWDDVEFIGALTYRIFGNVYYGNTGTTKPMETNTTIFLLPVLTGSATGPLGYYEFNDNLDGDYLLTGETTKPGNNSQITTADGIIASRMAAGIGTYTSLQFRAGDVNKSNAVTTSDAILVKRRAAGLTSSWSAPTYVFDGPFGTPNPVLGGIPVTVNGSDVQQEIRCLLSGDLNSSHTP